MKCFAGEAGVDFVSRESKVSKAQRLSKSRQTSERDAPLTSFDRGHKKCDKAQFAKKAVSVINMLRT